MDQIVNFKEISQAGLESSPVAATLAGLRAHEARYFMNKYKHAFSVTPAAEAPAALAYATNILATERDIHIASQPLEVSQFQVEDIQFTYVFFESGLAINVMYTLTDPKKRAVGFKLAEGMEIPAELSERFKFARQKSALAGIVRGSYFVIKGEYPLELV